MKTFAMVLGVVALAGTASADFKGDTRSLLSGTGGGYAGQGFGERSLLVINVQGTPSWDSFGGINTDQLSEVTGANTNSKMDYVQNDVQFHKYIKLGDNPWSNLSLPGVSLFVCICCIYMV